MKASQKLQSNYYQVSKTIVKRLANEKKEKKITKGGEKINESCFEGGAEV